MPTVLQRLLDEGELFAKEWYRGHKRKEFVSMFIGMNGAGQRFVYIVPFSGEASKVAALARLRTEFREHQIVAYAMLSETWISPSLNERIAKSDQQIKQINERPGKQADREERFYISAADGTNTAGRMFHMIRDHKDRVVDLTLDKEAEQGAAKVAGRMSELLDP